ncbi:hypothetical protein [Staphylococcus nepalensis]|uniref:hypothetical protein n=1 Tax=Staphylococcus nepalensis TaxID=214473 RepID=UPI00301A09C4
MVKIKREVKKNLPQLIEWGFNNTELTKGRVFNIDGENARFAPYVSFLADGTGVRVPCTITHDNTFTVEVEEEITESTVLPILIERRDFGNELTYSRYKYVRIKDIKEESSTLFYIENDDLTMTLIWRDGKLVE